MRTRCGEMPSEAGSVTVWAALMVVLATVIGGALFAAARHEIVGAQARAPADLVALAGVAGGRASAAALARANDAVLVSFEEQGDRVHVTVLRRSARAEATAQPGG